MIPFTSPAPSARWLRRVVAAAALAGFAALAAAQGPATGSIEGRVYDAGRGEFLENARVTVEGTTHETFTEAGGQYRLAGLAAGTVKVKVFFTGLVSKLDLVTVSAGQTVRHDVTMSASPGAGKGPVAGDATVRLAEFVVSTSKEMDGAAIAINEQRFARSIMNVVAADEFGTIVDGTPGEVLKFLPGITLDYSAGEARTISMNGVPAANVPITVGGFDLASAAGNGTSRVTNLDQFSVNSIARIEVRHSPTPESTGSALAGSVNMVPRSAFERSRPSYTASGFFTMKDAERSLSRTPGPLNRPTYKVTPGFNFNAIVPVNKTFGFTLSGNHVDQYSFEDVAASTWRGNGFATNAAATATTGLPDTTPDRPYLTDFALRDSTRGNRGDSAGLTLDYKLGRDDTLSFSFQYTWIGVVHNNRTFSFFVNRVLPGQWGPTFTRGAPGGFGEVRINGSAQDWYGTTSTPTLVWRHNGPLWKAEAGAGYSHATLHTRNVDKGFFGASQARRTGVTVSFDDIFYLRPNRITVTDAAGNPVDPYHISNFALDTANGVVRDSADLKRSINGSLRRDLEVRGLPVSLKGGFDLKSAERDLRATTETFNFWGADRVRTTSPVTGDDSAAVAFDEQFSQRNGAYGFPKIPHLSNDKYYALYRAHPEYFSVDPNTTYRAGVGASKRAQEIISSLYFRGDAAFFNRRLQLVGGVRAEQTNIRAEGPLTDPTGNYQRDASGEVVPRRDAAGNIVRNAQGVIQPALILPTTDTLGVSKLTYFDRGQRTRKEYLRLFPNLNASFNVRDNLIVRGAYYQSVGRPDFNQYSGGLTLPDTQNLPSTSNVISVNNAAIKAWSAETVKVRVEYYFERVGQINVSAFRRTFRDFFGSTRFNATPEFLGLYSLDPADYDAYDVVTNHNLDSTVQMTGFDFDYKQALTFLPAWARGVQVFFNASSQRATGDGAANFAGFIPRSGSWGWSLTRPKYVLRMNWNYRGAQRRGIIAAGRSIEANTYNWGSKRLYLDVTGEYNLRRNLTAFATLRNINDQTEDSKIYGPGTPDYAKFRQRVDYGSAWTFGLRGSF